MSGSTVIELQSNILFWILIALFAWQGYQRGLIAELVKMGFIAAGFVVGQPDLLGRTLVKAINGFWFAFQFLMHGGLQAIATGNFNAETLNGIFEEISQLPLLIPKDSAEMAMFLAMLFLVGVGYLASSLLKPQWPGLGLVAGAVNGFLLSYVFLPRLPKELPFQIEDLSVAGLLKQAVSLASYLLGLTIDVSGRVFGFFHQLLGAWTIPIMLLAAVVFVLMNIKPAKKKNGNGGGGGS